MSDAPEFRPRVMCIEYSGDRKSYWELNSKERESEEIAFIKSVRISVTAVSWKVNFSDTRMGDRRVGD